MTHLIQSQALLLTPDTAIYPWGGMWVKWRRGQWKEGGKGAYNIVDLDPRMWTSLHMDKTRIHYSSEMLFLLTSPLLHQAVALLHWIRAAVLSFQHSPSFTPAVVVMAPEDCCRMHKTDCIDLAGHKEDWSKL